MKNSATSPPRRGHTSRKTKRSSSRATRNGIRQIDGGYRRGSGRRCVEGRASFEQAEGYDRCPEIKGLPAVRNKVNQSGQRMAGSFVIGSGSPASASASRRPDARFFHAVPCFFSEGEKPGYATIAIRERVIPCLPRGTTTVDPRRIHGGRLATATRRAAPMGQRIFVIMERRWSLGIRQSTGKPLALDGHDNAILIMHVNWFPSPARNTSFSRTILAIVLPRRASRY